VSLRIMRMWLSGALLAALATTALFPPSQAFGQEEGVSRKLRVRVAPLYPEIAKRMSITGRVKLAVVISANGSIKDAKVIGGHPILVNAAMDAVKKWKYEPAPSETSGTIEVSFEGKQQ
jgi:TonB family protein